MNLPTSINSVFQTLKNLGTNGAAPLTDFLTMAETRLVAELKGRLYHLDCAPMAERIDAEIHALGSIAYAIRQYPSPFKTQTLGGKVRTIDTLVDALASSSSFTLEMSLPTQAVVGRTFVTARINFFRLLAHIVEETQTHEVKALRAKISQLLLRAVYSKVTEELLTQVACDSTQDVLIRKRAARVLIYLWEDRLHRDPTSFFSVLEGTWEARRRLKPVFGTMMGTSEVFSLMREGCDTRFVEYFSRIDCRDEEMQAFREFLFGLTAEEINDLQDFSSRYTLPTLQSAAVQEWCRHHRGFLMLEDDSATGFYTFFVRRHLISTSRAIANMPGPHRTAEEYVMVHFLSEYWNDINLTNGIK